MGETANRAGLGMSPDPIDEYGRMLRSADEATQVSVLHKLAAIGGGAAAGAIRRELAWLGPAARKVAGETLAILGDSHLGQCLLGDSLDFIRCAKSVHPEVVYSLEAALGDAERASPSQRAAAAEALGFVHDEAAVEPLARALEDPAHGVRAAAAAALLHNAAPGTGWALVQVVLDGSVPARAAAARLLGQLGERGVRGALIRALGDDSGDVRREAAHALDALGDPQWRAPVLGDADDFDRLGRHPSALALTPLARALGSDAGDVQHRAVDALCRHEVAAVMSQMVEVIERRGWRARIGAAEVLGTLGIGPPRALAFFTTALADRDPDVRVHAAQALGALRDRRALDVLRSTARDGDVRVRAAAVLALQRIGAGSGTKAE